MPTYKTPGVKIEEIRSFPPSVVPVATAIPAFIGYTNKITHKGNDLTNVPTKIDSLIEYVEIFGMVKNEVTAIELDDENKIISPPPVLTYRMFYSLQMFFNNGGRECYVVSVGDDSGTTISETDLTDGLEALKKENEPTIIVIPDAIGMKKSLDEVGEVFDDGNYYSLMKMALSQCKELKSRVVIVDVPRTSSTETTNIGDFRTDIGTENLDYGIAYYPELETTLNFVFDEYAVKVKGGKKLDANGVPTNNNLTKTDGTSELRSIQAPSSTPGTTDPIPSLYHSEYRNIYDKIIDFINVQRIMLTPSAAMAGVFARVDRTRGVHIAPANVSIVGGKPTFIIDDDKQRDLNIPNDGKSINAIRVIKNRGNAVVWGARTLDGSSNEWRYVNVRRYFIYAEQSIKAASYQFVFEPNNKNTWERVKAMIVNFLTNEWSGGALAGEKPEDAFFVRVGLGDTMSALDILEGRMNIEVGLAVVRPAEFIILKFSHKMQEA